MIDIVKLKLVAGNGGHGRVAFRHEKYVPKGGPNGGDGGHGGNIIIRANKGLNTLQHFAGKKEFVAQSGALGGKKLMFGVSAEDMVLEVPVGVIVWLLGENQMSYNHRQFSSHYQARMVKYEVEKETLPAPVRELDEIRPLADLPEDAVAAEWLDIPLKAYDFRLQPKLKLFEFTEDGQELVIVKGGRGGKGNTHYASASHQVPLEAEYGEFGEQKIVVFEQKLLADIGLVGYPNAGKSTLLSVLTKARPRIASYPFTTITPHLGVMQTPDSATHKEAVIADIPGLVAGASEGKGLGHTFLRHVENCRLLLILLSLEETDVFDENLSDEEKAKSLEKQYDQLMSELTSYNESLKDKPYLVVVSKIDIYTPELLKAIETVFQKRHLEISSISAATGKGLAALAHRCAIALD